MSLLVVHIVILTIYWSSLNHDLIASISEKAISILAGNLNSSGNYLITAVTQLLQKVQVSNELLIAQLAQTSTNLRFCFIRIAPRRTLLEGVVSAGLGDLLLTMHVGMFLIKASYYNYIPGICFF